MSIEQNPFQSVSDNEEIGYLAPGDWLVATDQIDILLSGVDQQRFYKGEIVFYLDGKVDYVEFLTSPSG